MNCKHSIVVEEGQVYLTEIKATSQSRLVLTPKEIDRLVIMIRAAEKNPPLKCRLVIHFKRRGWQTILLNSVGEIPTFFFFNNSTSYDL